MYATSTSPPRSGCGRCLDDAWIECRECGRWYCGPCSRALNGGSTACAHCYPAVGVAPPNGGDP